MSVFVLDAADSIAGRFLAQIRDREIQKDRARFRKNMLRLGQIMAYEISKSLTYETVKLHTPLAETESRQQIDKPVIISILRAGMPFFDGFLDFFDEADCGFIGAYRGAQDEENRFEIEMHYTAVPDLNGRTLILADPMLATGKSLLRTLQALEKYGKPSAVHIAAVIASRPGVEFLQKEAPEAQIWTAALDETLNAKSYIVPGLGDAGDLAYGEKL